MADSGPAIEDTQEAEHRLIERLRLRDEDAFTQLVNEHHERMLRVARLYVRDSEVANEVVQEAWLGALKGLDRFEGRSSLKTWLTSITMNIARTRSRVEQRSSPISVERGADDWAEDEEVFSAGGQWVSIPTDWAAIPDHHLLSSETRTIVGQAIAALPQRQREIVELRDVAGWTSDEVCNVLNLTETNQRVLLHRARAKLRKALETYLVEPR